MQLGVFGHAHTFLEKGKLIAQPGLLHVTELPPSEEAGGGVLVDFGPSSRAQIHFAPIEIAIPNTNDIRHRVEFSAMGARDNSYAYLGSLTLVNSNGVLDFSLRFVYPNDYARTVQIFSNNLLVGSSQLPAIDGPSVRIDGMPRLLACDVTADTLAGPNIFGLTFDTNATFTFSNATQLVGNRLVVLGSPADLLADVKTIAILAHDIPSFTIINETSEMVTPRIEIVQSGTNVLLRWADPAKAFAVEFKTSTEECFSSTGFEPTYTNGIATVAAALPSSTAFFRLRRFSYPYQD